MSGNRAPTGRRIGAGVRSAGWVALFLLGSALGCSPIYVIKAGLAEWEILRAREPLGEVLVDPSVDLRVREKLAWALEARSFVRDSLGFDIGDIYTTYVELESDTLAHILSASPVDRLEPKTWWFPVVGRVPYRGYFDLEGALKAERKLVEEGYDTYLRPTPAFSTLGWFSDPILSTFLHRDEVDLVGTLIHELAHVHLYLPNQVRFNESFAQFVGHTGAIEFFCTRSGSGPLSVKCARARARWRDAIRFSQFIDPLVNELDSLYAELSLEGDQASGGHGTNSAIYHAEVSRRRDQLFAAHLRRFRDEVQPTFEASTYGGFLSTPLNNATLLARMRYFHRLADFDALLVHRGGKLRDVVEWVATSAGELDDPFEILTPSPSPPGFLTHPESALNRR